MKINKLNLVNFRCFEDYEITLSDRFTLLIGDKGSGKTAVFDSLAIAAGVFLYQVPGLSSEDARIFVADDVRYNLKLMGQTVIKETEQDVTYISAKGLIYNMVMDWKFFKEKNYLMNTINKVMTLFNYQ